MKTLIVMSLSLFSVAAVAQEPLVLEFEHSARAKKLLIDYKTAVDTARADLTRAEQIFQNVNKTQREKLITQLRAIQTAETKEGNLDAALEIRTSIDSLLSTDDDAGVKYTRHREIRGVWLISHSTITKKVVRFEAVKGKLEMTELDVISAEGKRLGPHEKKYKSGSRADSTYVYQANDAGGVARYHVKEGTIYSEYWKPGRRVGVGIPDIFGVGQKVRWPEP